MRRHGRAGGAVSSPVAIDKPYTPSLSFEHETWMDGALCAQVDMELFFPPKGGSVRPAIAICKACDVIDECLAFAVEREERFGVWGGLTERARRPLYRRAAATAAQARARQGPKHNWAHCPTCHEYVSLGQHYRWHPDHRTEGARP